MAVLYKQDQMSCSKTKSRLLRWKKVTDLSLTTKCKKQTVDNPFRNIYEPGHFNLLHWGSLLHCITRHTLRKTTSWWTLIHWTVETQHWSSQWHRASHHTLRWIIIGWRKTLWR